MKTAEEKAYKTPIEDLRKSALEHYEEASNAIHSWRSEIPRAINFYYDNHEYANQQPETEPMFKTSKDITEHEKWKQPKQGEVDALQYNEMVQFLRKWKVDSNAIADLRGLIKSTLTQDN